MSSTILGAAKKSRGIFEGAEFAGSLKAANISVPDWDLRLRWVTNHVSTQPLVDTTAFLTHPYRLMQIWFPNRMIGWLYFRIEPNDENCTLLWVQAKWFHRVG
jgi:hypothetical protein